MTNRGVALSVGLAALVLVMGWGTASAQPMPTNPVAMANVRQSEHYSKLLRTDPSFRAKRIREECGPITDPHLHAQCVASFPGGH